MLLSAWGFSTLSAGAHVQMELACSTSISLLHPGSGIDVIALIELTFAL